jgi:ketosteroid isomerase-like protein
LVLVLFLVAPIIKGPPAEQPSQSEYDRIVRALDNQERLAVLERDRAGMDRLWSDHLVVNAPNNELLIGKAAVLDWVERGIINFSAFERQTEFVRVDGDVAVIMGGENVTPIGDAPAAGLRAGQTIQRRFTHIWRRNAGTWRLYARHANVVSARR